ncbi:MAG: hypothetical protein ABJL54_10565 [Halioglobus sp.]
MHELISRQVVVTSVLSLFLTLVASGCTETVRQNWKDLVYPSSDAAISNCKNLRNDGYQPVLDSTTGEFIACVDTWEQQRRHEAVTECARSGGKVVENSRSGDLQCREAEAKD